jgi:hypothetical protein
LLEYWFLFYYSCIRDVTVIKHKKYARKVVFNLGYAYPRGKAKTS